MLMEWHRAIELHKRTKGKVKTYPSLRLRTKDDLSCAYFPGSYAAADLISKNNDASFEYTGRGNSIFVVSNGSSILGLKEQDPFAALPILEGKCLIYKVFGDINAFPLCLEAKSAEEIIETCKLITPTVGGINLSNISSLTSFEILRKLQSSLDIPVSSDDHYGIAVALFGALKNALRIVGKDLSDITIAIWGAGKAGISTARLLLAAGANRITMVNSHGILTKTNPYMSKEQAELAEKLDLNVDYQDIKAAISQADVLIGLSTKDAFEPDYIKLMNQDPIVFALALPEPEINPALAKEKGAAIVASSLYWTTTINPIASFQVYPGIMRGALDVRAATITTNMLLRAADGFAQSIDEKRLSPDNIVPPLFSDEVTPRIAEAVAQAAIEEGVALNPLPKNKVYAQTWERLFGGRII
jgi:malate dehydrogenase (oxaloacetate-decarboxylating)